MIAVAAVAVVAAVVVYLIQNCNIESRLSPYSLVHFLPDKLLELVSLLLGQLDGN